MSGRDDNNDKQTRRDFLFMTTGAVGAVGMFGCAKVLINSMNPSADVMAASSVDVDLRPIAAGQSMTVMWRGKPLFIRHRTAEEIQQAESDNHQSLPDPQNDQDRVLNAQWLVVVGVCTHLGCVPSGQRSMDNKGDYNGWLCPCHGSHYDSSGRIRQGPAPSNLEVPPYKFVNDYTIRIGSNA